MQVIAIHDETAAGTVLQRLVLEVEQETITARELITQRVRQEVADYNRRSTGLFSGLVQPTNSERVLNGFRLLRRQQPIDAEKQLYRALEAFQQNSFFILVNDQQVESLDEQLWLGLGATVSFVKLTPLVGG